MLKQIADTKNINDLDFLTEIFRSGCKTGEKTGIEFEKIGVYSDSLKAVRYPDIARFLQTFKNGNWSGVYEGNNIIGLKNETGTISLEPGSQLEISLNPLDTIAEIENKITEYNKITARIAEKMGIIWLGYGIQPLSTNKNIKIIPKKRYEYMTRYLPTIAKKPLVMMRETSGIQTGIDYKSEQDAMKKLSLALKLSPIISAAFANSPVRGGKLTGYKSYRAFSWLHTDNDRCGLVSSKLFERDFEFSFEDYAKILLNVPMIFIERKGIGAIPVKNLTFSQFLKDGYEGFTAQIEDWELHLSLYFPDVRLKSYLEIRNHDNQRPELIPAVPAFWKGLLYSENASNEALELLKPFSYIDFEYIRRKTPKCGLSMNIKGYNLAQIATEALKISHSALKKAGIGEEKYLEPLLELTKEGKTPADVIIDRWNGTWNKDLQKLIEYSTLR